MGTQPAADPPSGPRLFCSRPFDTLEVHDGGTAFVCCPSWVPKSIGNVTRDHPRDVWNSPAAQELRASILDGSFRHCDRELCAHLAKVDGPVRRVEDVTDPDLRHAIATGSTRMTRGPRRLIACYDRSCNLACPTCRADRIMASAGERERLKQLQDGLLDAFLADLRLLHVTGSGDPFGSPVFLELLTGLDAATHPELRLHLHTNAQLFTPARWDKLQRAWPMMESVEVSIDAATPATYAENRRPGTWERLVPNMEFLAGLRRDGRIRHLSIDFVVQANNWREMPAFVDLGRGWNADLVYFGQIVNWSFKTFWKFSRHVFSAAEFRRRAVHLPGHPEHDAFVAMLASAPFGDRDVMLGNLGALRAAAVTAPA